MRLRAGFNRMNNVVVQQTSQGLAAYLVSTSNLPCKCEVCQAWMPTTWWFPDNTGLLVCGPLQKDVCPDALMKGGVAIGGDWGTMCARCPYGSPSGTCDFQQRSAPLL